MSSAEQQSPDKVQRILAATLELFEQKGYHGTPLREILERAEVSKGIFYYYFQSKDELLRHIHNEFITKELKVAEEILRSDLPAREKIYQMILDVVRTVALYKPHVTVFFQERRFLSRDKFASILEKRDRYAEIMKLIVQEGVRKGELRSDLDPFLIVFALFGLANWTYQWFEPGKRLSYEDVAKTYAEIFMSGVGTGEGHRPAGS